MAMVMTASIFQRDEIVNASSAHAYIDQLLRLTKDLDV